MGQRKKTKKEKKKEKKERRVRGAKFPRADDPTNEVLCVCVAVHPNGVSANNAKRARTDAIERDKLRWEDKQGDRREILKRQGKAELDGGWYEVFYHGRLNEQRVKQLRGEKPVFFHRAGNELGCLAMFRDRLAQLRPEFPLTWNGNGFDLPFIDDRLRLHHGKRAHEVYDVSDMVGAPTEWAARRERWGTKQARFASKQAGKRGGRDVQWPGMPWTDVMQTVIKTFKLRSYKLDSVAEAFLGEHKEDMDPAHITPTWDRDENGAADVASYCCWDAELPWRISQARKLTEDMVQMARVTMVPPQLLNTRGASIQSYIQVLAEAKIAGFLVHHHEPPPEVGDGTRGEAKFKGAVVIDPSPGFYPQPVLTLDFSSLYPSEAISHNLCWTTWVPPWMLDSVPEADRFQTPAGHWFVHPHVRKGLLPARLRRVLAARKDVRAEGERADDEGDVARARSMDTRQLKLKVVANSMYGYTGAEASLPCFAVSESITAYGRRDIMMVKGLVEERYPGFRVIYGDTDSVMVLTPEGTTVEEALRIMREMAKMVNAVFADDPNSVMSITPEKVYTNYRLLTKKRYAGLFWTRPDKPDKVCTCVCVFIEYTEWYSHDRHRWGRQRYVQARDNCDTAVHSLQWPRGVLHLLHRLFVKCVVYHLAAF